MVGQGKMYNLKDQVAGGRLMGFIIGWLMSILMPRIGARRIHAQNVERKKQGQKKKRQSFHHTAPSMPFLAAIAEGNPTL